MAYDKRIKRMAVTKPKAKLSQRVVASSLDAGSHTMMPDWVEFVSPVPESE